MSGWTRPVAVKPLVWARTSYGTPVVYTIVGVYRINHAENGGWKVIHNRDVLRGDDGREDFAAIKDAKAAAQSDYDQRIRFALASQPQEGEAEPVAYADLEHLARKEPVGSVVYPFPTGTCSSPIYAHPPTDTPQAEAVGEKCDDCGRHYQLTYRVPDHVWEKIAPKPIEGFKGGGLLCPDCASRRASDKEVELFFEAHAGWWPEDKGTDYIERLEARAQSAESRLAEAVEALKLAKQKLEIYRAEHSGEYTGGPEYRALMDRIDRAIVEGE